MNLRTFLTIKPVRTASLVIPMLLLLAACASPAGPQVTPTLPQATSAPPSAPTMPQPTTAQQPTPPIQEPTAASQPAEGSLPVTGAAIQVADNSQYGQILVDANGMTLYNFEIDTPTESKCVESDCVANWPPLIVTGQVTAGAGVTGELGTITRPDGSLQATYNGRPLYTFSLDQQPGDANGEGFNEFGGIWHVTPANGEIPNTSGGNVQPTAPPPPDDGYNYPY